MRLKIIRKDIVYYVRYMVRFNTGMNLNYIPCYNLPEQEIDIKIIADPDKVAIIFIINL